MAEIETRAPLLDYVRSLESRSNRERGEQVLTALRALGLEPRIQESRLLRVRNFIIDFSQQAPEFLMTAHYDTVRGSPGANDNASGVAVLLGLCETLRNTSLPVRVVFFDREESWLRTPLFALGVLGSLHYVLRTGLRKLRAVFNLEFCGSGDFLGIWPVREREMGTEAVARATRAAAKLGIPFGVVHIPWVFLSSDHLSFRLRGMRSSVTLSLLPADQAPALGKTLSGLSLRKLLAGQRPVPPEPLSLVHTSGDTSSRLSEASLQLMLSLLREVLRW